MPDCRRALDTLFDAPGIARNFSSIPALFPTQSIDRGTGDVSPLPDGPALTLCAEDAAWLDAHGADVAR